MDCKVPLWHCWVCKQSQVLQWSPTKVLLEDLGSLPKQMYEKATRFWLVCALDRISARHWWRGWRWSQTLKKLMVLPHPLNVCSCFNPLCLLHTTLFFINTSIINLTCIIIVTTFLTQSFSAASAVQTDSSNRANLTGEYRERLRQWTSQMDYKTCIRRQPDKCQITSLVMLQ